MPLYVRELGVTDPGGIALWSGLIAASTPAISGALGPFFGRLADTTMREWVRSIAPGAISTGSAKGGGKRVKRSKLRFHRSRGASPGRAYR